MITGKQKYIWIGVGIGCAIALGYGCYRWLSRKRYPIPQAELDKDEEALGPMIQVRYGNLIEKQMITLEAIVWKHFRAYSRAQREVLQKQRVALLEKSNRSGYSAVVLKSLKCYAKDLAEVAEQVCDFFHIPLELYHRTQEYFKSASGRNYQAQIEAQSGLLTTKNPHKLTKDEAVVLREELNKCLREAEDSPPTIAKAELPSELKTLHGFEVEKIMQHFEVFDKMYQKYKLTDDEIQEVLNHFGLSSDISEVASLE